jgi:deazaflavin-dependent oxidoreductase (nitroreductase family)
MLMTFKGRKSGKQYSIPVNYARNNDTFLVVTEQQRKWWKNFEYSTVVSVNVKRQILEGSGKAITDEKEVMKHITDYLKILPQYAKYFGVKTNTDGSFNQEDISKAAQDKIGILIQVINTIK